MRFYIFCVIISFIRQHRLIISVELAKSGNLIIWYLFAANMDVPMFSESVTQQLKLFAQQCMDDPSLLHDPKLSFIKELIEYFGGKVPEAKANGSSDPKCKFESKPEESQSESEPEPESEESDLELDMTGVIG